MKLIYKATTRTSDLMKSTGYWSGKKIIFNSDPVNIIILDKTLTVSDLYPMIIDHLNSYLEKDVRQNLDMILTRKKLSAADFVRSGSIKGLISVNKSPVFHKDKFIKDKQVRLSLIADWLQEDFPSEKKRLNKLAHLITKTYLEDAECKPGTIKFNGLHILLNNQLLFVLDALSNENKNLEHALSLLCSSVFTSDNRGKQKRNHLYDPDGFKNLQSISGFKENWLKGYCYTKFLHATGLLLGLLWNNGKILLPTSIIPERVIHSYKGFIDIPYGDNPSNNTLIGRLVLASNIRTLRDIPEDITLLAQHAPFSGSLNSAISNQIIKYADKNKLKPFPLNNLQRHRYNKKTHTSTYTHKWLKENGVPSAWLKFAKLLRSTSSGSESSIRSKIRISIEWAWFHSGFEKPSSITMTDIRDPHNPSRTDTFHHYLKNHNADGKWNMWNEANKTFSIVYNASLLSKKEDDMVLQINPFEPHQNPFRQKKQNTTSRRRIPTNAHEAMLQVLLSPDDNGKPTWSFVKDTLKLDWFNWKNPETGEIERTWCPSRSHLMALMLVLPLRTSQARWLDQGLMDNEIWDMETMKYIPNKHALRQWRYPNGETQEKFCGRPTGVLQPGHDSIYQSEELSIYVNTNKTQLWDPEITNGYEIWWPRGELLRKEDISNLVKQADYLDRPYDILEAQKKWMETYDPNPEPISFFDSTVDKMRANKALAAHYPFFTPLFRDISSLHHRDDNTIIYLPVGDQKLGRLISALAVHTETKLKEQGVDIILTKPATGARAYAGRKFKYDKHSLRVYGISYLIELGIPVEIVQTIAGHAAVAMTLYYNKVSPDWARMMISDRVAKGGVLGDWDEIAEDISQNKKEFIITNNAFHKDQHPNEQLADYTGFTHKPGGLCPLGGDACHIGQVTYIQSKSGKTGETYSQVIGGCGNCRFFCTTPAHLFEHQMVINDLMIKIKSHGKHLKSLAKRFDEISWSTNDDSHAAKEKAELKSKLEDTERQIEPMIREWLNRSKMAIEAINNVDDYVDYLKDLNQSDGGMVLLSASSAEDLAPHIEMRMEESGEFNLARQTLLAAHLQGGIEHCSELSKTQIVQFMDGINIHDDPRHLLISIPDKSTREKVAFLMSEMMASMAGTTAVQKAIDDGTGLQLESNTKQEIHNLLNSIFHNAQKLGRNATLKSLIPDKLKTIKGEVA